MAKITQIKPQKNKKRINIYLDGKFAFPLDADNFLKAGLKIGQRLSEKEIKRLRDEDVKGKLYDKVLKFLSYRPRSEKEIRDYLEKKGGNTEVIKKITRKLKRQKLVDDAAFAAWWIEQRLTFRPRGKKALRMELTQKGINRELAEEVINQMVDELALAEKVVQKKVKAYRKLELLEFREKMTAFLARRGFSWETIKKVLFFPNRRSS